MRIKERLGPIAQRLLYTFLFLIVFVVQSVFLGDLPVAVTLLAPLTVAVCFFESELGGLLFGLLGGALYDIASPAADGVYTLLFALLGCVCALLVRYVFRNTLLSALLLAFVFTLLAALTGFLFTVLSKDTSGAAALLSRRVLPGVPITTLTLPLFYYPARAIRDKCRRPL